MAAVVIAARRNKNQKYLSLTSDMWSSSAMTAAHMHILTYICFIFHQPRQTCSRPHTYTFINAFILLSLSLRTRARALTQTRSSHTRTHWPHINFDLTTRPMTNYFYQMLLLSSPRTTLMQFYHSKKSHWPRTFERNVISDAIAIPNPNKRLSSNLFPFVGIVSLKWKHNLKEKCMEIHCPNKCNEFAIVAVSAADTSALQYERSAHYTAVDRRKKWW